MAKKTFKAEDIINKLREAEVLTSQGYMNLPKAYANLQPVKDGKTAKQLLVEQLTLLDIEMKEVVQEVYRNDTQKLIAHGRFLQDKFQKSLLDI